MSPVQWMSYLMQAVTMTNPMGREEQILSLLTAWSEKNYTPPLDINDLYDLVEPISDLLAQARVEGAVRALAILHEKYDKRHEERGCKECDSYAICSEKSMAVELLQESLMLDGKLPIDHEEDRVLTDHLITQYQTKEK